tara:strand:+ start:6388 stop:6642 length:255 start_codon:yes stop_codon:yes gene_type:complete
MTLLKENPPEIGADTAVSHVPTDYKGPCAVVQSQTSANVIAVLPSVMEANRVARYAISPSGGYGSVYVEPTDLAVTCLTLEAWL